MKKDRYWRETDFVARKRQPRQDLPAGFIEALEAFPAASAGHEIVLFESSPTGNCQWCVLNVNEHPQGGGKRIVPIELPEDRAQEAQRAWLSALRRQFTLDRLLADIGREASRSTWLRGWEQRRPLPFFVAVRLSRFIQNHASELQATPAPGNRRNTSAPLSAAYVPGSEVLQPRTTRGQFAPKSCLE